MNGVADDCRPPFGGPPGEYHRGTTGDGLGVPGEGRRDPPALSPVLDTYGHAAGDAVLEHIGSLLRLELRADDNCARIGGEEFAILLPITDRELAFRLAEKLCRRIAGSAASYGEGARSVALRVTASFGVATGWWWHRQTVQRGRCGLVPGQEPGAQPGGGRRFRLPATRPVGGVTFRPGSCAGPGRW